MLLDIAAETLSWLLSVVIPDGRLRARPAGVNRGGRNFGLKLAGGWAGGKAKAGTAFGGLIQEETLEWLARWCEISRCGFGEL